MTGRKPQALPLSPSQGNPGRRALRSGRSLLVVERPRFPAVQSGAIFIIPSLGQRN